MVKEMKKKQIEDLDKEAERLAEKFIKEASPEQLKQLDKLLSRVSPKEDIRITKSTKRIHCPCCGHEIQIHLKEESI